MKVQFTKVVTVEGEVFEEDAFLRIVTHGSNGTIESIVNKDRVVYAEETHNRGYSRRISERHESEVIQ